MLYKWYPQKGEFAGGIIFRRYFGIGCGIPFTAEELEEVQAGINIGACSTLDVSAPAASDCKSGDSVEAHREGAWVVATVLAVRSDGSLDLFYVEGGAAETGVLPVNVRQHTRARPVEDSQAARARKKRQREGMADERAALRARRDEARATSKRELRFAAGRELMSPPPDEDEDEDEDGDTGADIKPNVGEAEDDRPPILPAKLTASELCELGDTTARTNYSILTWGDCGSNRQEVRDKCPVALTLTHTTPIG
jgi:hypothetical protein